VCQPSSVRLVWHTNLWLRGYWIDWIISSFFKLAAQRKQDTFYGCERRKNSDVYQAIERIVGSLDEPDTGILFTLPIDDLKGFKH
jgi:hypothetical protein